MNQQRKEQIVEMIVRERSVKNADLMRIFDVSIETVRRDLAYLERRGLLKRVYGGAVAPQPLGQEPEYTCREQENRPEKVRIAMEAARLVGQHDVIFFDLGTTVLAMVPYIKPDCHITAFTNALRTAIALSDLPGCQIMLPGGQLRPGELTLSGYPAEQNMEQFNVDKVFIGVGGITEDGISDYHTAECSLRRQAVANARQVIALADGSKFGVRAMNKVCSLRDVDVLITDESAPEDLLQVVEKAGVKVIVAGK